MVQIPSYWAVRAPYWDPGPEAGFSLTSIVDDPALEGKSVGTWGQLNYNAH